MNPISYWKAKFGALRHMYRKPVPLSPEMRARLIQILRLLRPLQVIGFAKMRIGRSANGGYVMLDDFSRTERAYSLGIGPDVSWDWDMAQRGVLVFQYDHTVKGPPWKHPLFSFFPREIVAEENPSGLTLQQCLSGTDSRHLILKMDIEGAEWPVLETIPSEVLSRFEQIVLELHYFSKITDLDYFQRIEQVLTKLNLTHQVIHVHANVLATKLSFGSQVIPETLEVSYVRKDHYRFAPSRETFPTALDLSSAWPFPDFKLGTFHFE